MWPDMPTYGRKSAQFVDLLSYCTISTPHIIEKVSNLCCQLWSLSSLFLSVCLCLCLCLSLSLSLSLSLPPSPPSLPLSLSIFPLTSLIVHTHTHTHTLQEPLCQSYVERAIALLKVQNGVVATHQNSHIYSQLMSMVDFDGYYLENKPCLVCNNPEIAYSVSVVWAKNFPN